MSECGMTEQHRKILKKNYVTITRDMQVDQVLPRMKHIFTEQDEDEIKCKATERKRAEKMLDILPRKGGDAFEAFVSALKDVQPWIARLVSPGLVENNLPVLPALGQPTQEYQQATGMENTHREMLGKFIKEFTKSLNVVQMVRNLKDADVINEMSEKQILEKPTQTLKVEELITNVLPKCGPEAFRKFYKCLECDQPQLAQDFKTKAKEIYPKMIFESEKSSSLNKKPHSQETKSPSTNDEKAMSSSSQNNFSLSMSCSHLPETVKQLIYDTLDAEPNELLENDWKMLYKKLNLPPGKEEIIRKKDSPTKFVLTTWIQKGGREEASLQILLDVLKECHHGDLVDKIKNILHVNDLPVEQPNEQIDGMLKDMTITPEKKVYIKNLTPLKLINDIPEILRKQLLEKLTEAEQLKNGVLGEMATTITEKRCYVCDAADFIEKMKLVKIRFLFSELRKQQPDIASWMRKKFPPGSTGPFKQDDELRANEMLYSNRRQVTQRLDIDQKWKEVAELAGLNTTDIKYMEQRKKEPAESVISYWEVRSATTVGALYELLVAAGIPSVADLL